MGPTAARASVGRAAHAPMTVAARQSASVPVESAYAEQAAKTATALAQATAHASTDGMTSRNYSGVL